MAKTIIRITTVPMAFRVLLSGQPKYMEEHGFRVIMISADGRELQDVIDAERCEHITVPMTRKITPLSDLQCYFKLVKIFKKFRPAIIHTHTPKAGLLGMLAARTAGVKIRIHTVAGLPVMLETGWKKRLLLFTEWLTYKAATHVWPNSMSMMKYIVRRRLTSEKKLNIIGNGSTNGVDLNRFSKKNLSAAKRFEIAQTVPVVGSIRILCVGRMVRDKGIEELVSVFQRLKQKFSLQLLLVGPFEPTLDPLSEATMKIIREDPAIVHVPWSNEVEYYMDIADVFVHPSHREGFPNVILQAGAMHLSVACSDIPGNCDIVKHNKTGLLFKVNDEQDLEEKMLFILQNRDKASLLAVNLNEEIRSLYDRGRVHEELLKTYNNLLAANESKH